VLKDKAAGNLVSAKMNLKLALTFDPTNQMFHRAIEQISKNSPEQAASRAKMFYDKATTAERLGDVDGAIEYLEQALAEAKDAAYFNRLGVLLATKKHEFQRAQELLEEALRRSPGNATYEQNMGKILQLAAKASVESREDGRGAKKKGLLGFLGRKK
jgi:tetratricopeptide (TPR) repeat protein